MNFNFTESVRTILSEAREEALRLGHDYVGTEHILLGMTKLDGFLQGYGLDVAQVADRVDGTVQRGKLRGRELRELPYTSRAKKVIELSMASARELNSSYVGADHLLLGLLREEKGIGAQLLTSFGLDLEAAHQRATETPLERPPQPRLRGKPRFQVRIDDGSTLSIYEQIITQIREAVATGALQPGERILPVRGLADELDIAPGTVARAYAELERLGVVVTSGARGTRVAEARRKESPPHERVETLTGLLRPVAVAAFHMGGTAAELREALESAMKGILDAGPSAR